MTDGFLAIIDVQQILGSIISQVSSIFDPEKFQFLDTLGIFWDKVLDNPLASIITVLVLVGLPYTLFKAKESSSQASDRLDRLMEEMKDFEFEKPLIDLQDKFKDAPIESSLVRDYHQDVAGLTLDNEVPDLSFDEDPDPHELEPATFSKQLTLDQEMTDDFLVTGSLDQETDDESPEMAPLANEILEETGISGQESSVEDEEFVNQYFDDTQEKDDDRELVAATEGNSKGTEISQPQSDAEKEELASHGIDDLQSRMEQAIKNLRVKYPSRDDRGIPSNGEKGRGKNEDPSASGEYFQEEDPTSTESIQHGSDQDGSLKKNNLISSLKSFQKNLEKRFDSKVHEKKY